MQEIRAQKLTWSKEVGFPDGRCLVFVVKFNHVVIGLREPIGQRGYEQIQEQKPAHNNMGTASPLSNPQ